MRRFRFSVFTQKFLKTFDRLFSHHQGFAHQDMDAAVAPDTNPVERQAVEMVMALVVMGLYGIFIAGLTTFRAVGRPEEELVIMLTLVEVVLHPSRTTTNSGSDALFCREDFFAGVVVLPGT